MAVELTAPSRFGPLLRQWRRRRRMSQLDLALEAGTSARHVSFVETGRAQPSREMVLRLAEHLAIPLRDRNALLVAAGHAPVYEHRDLDDAALAPVRAALDLVLRGHEPFPALVVDRRWELVAANRSIALLLDGVADELLQPPVNVLRVTLHPEGVAPRIANLGDVRLHLLDRLAREIAMTGDPQLEALMAELATYPAPVRSALPADGDAGIVVPLRVDTRAGELSLFSTIATFGTAVDVTVAELSIESFFAADAATAEAVRGWHARAIT